MTRTVRLELDELRDGTWRAVLVSDANKEIVLADLGRTEWDAMSALAEGLRHAIEQAKKEATC